jgi:hypothetical protein
VFLLCGKETEDVHRWSEDAMSQPQDLATAGQAMLASLSRRATTSLAFLHGVQLYYIKSNELAQRGGQGSFARWWQHTQQQADSYCQTTWTVTTAEQWARAGYILLWVRQHAQCSVEGEQHDWDLVVFAIRACSQNYPAVCCWIDVLDCLV